VLGDGERVLIVGTGMSGGNVAATLREEGHRGPVVLIGAEPGVPFGRPPLSKTYLRSEENLSGWLVKPEEWYDANGIERRGAEVRHLDTALRQVVLDDGERMGYGRLVWCAGGRPRRPDLPGVDLPGVHFLRTVADCDAIKGAARPGARALVVGMGFIGSEVAASLRDLGLHVTAVMSGAAPLENVLGEEVGAVMGDIHREHGVELIASDRVVRFEGDGALERGVTQKGVTIECELAIVGAGVVPNVEPLVGASVATDNGVLVDARCRTNVDGVLAVGDCANQLHPLFGRVRVEHYNNAEKMGRCAARALLGDEAPYDYVHTFWSDQYEHSLEYVGHATTWDEVVLRGSLQERRCLVFLLRGGVLHAALGLNRGGDPELDSDGELYACKGLVGRRFAHGGGVLADGTVDIRALARSNEG